MAQYNYYANPGFCQQSEFYDTSPTRIVTPPRNVNYVKRSASLRRSPVGALSKTRTLETPPQCERNMAKNFKEQRGNYEEQEFYEELIVDNNGKVREKKFVVVSSPGDNARSKEYVRNHRYEYIDDDYEGNVRHVKNRYEYIPMTHQDTSCSNKARVSNETAKYALVPLHEAGNNDRYAVITEDDIIQASKYEAQESRSNTARLERRNSFHGTNHHKMVHSPVLQKKGNPIATQRLHELLSTPKKMVEPTDRRMLSPRSPRKSLSPLRGDVFVTPKKGPQKTAPKAQQKLNYSANPHQNHERRHTAVVAPLRSSPVQSACTETTSSQRDDSWKNLSIPKSSVEITLTLTAALMLACGVVNSVLCLYMKWKLEGLYYLDLGAVAGFTCLMLGLLGFRGRNYYWLPNRNYISGKSLF